MTYLLELRGEQLWLRTGSRPQDEVTEVYASAAEAADAAHFVRDRWRAEGFAPWESFQRPILTTAAPPPPRAGGLLLGASGAPAREPPKPLRRIQAEDPWARDPRLGELERDGSLEVVKRENGALVAAKVHVTFDAESPRDRPLKVLLKARSAKTLQRLVVEGEDEGDFKSAVTVLSKGVPEALRDLTLCTVQTLEVFHEMKGNPTAALPQLSGLKRLVLQAGHLTFSEISLPGLEFLSVRASALDRTALQAIAAASWPELRSLTLWFGAREEGSSCTLDALRPLLSAERFPRLRCLRLHACEFADEAVKGLAESTLLPRLEKLDLSMGLVSDASAPLLRGERFAHLEKLLLADTALSVVVRRELTAQGPRFTAYNPLFGNAPTPSVGHFVPADEDLDEDPEESS